MKVPSKRGGKRPGAGRKPKPKAPIEAAPSKPAEDPHGDRAWMEAKRRKTVESAPVDRAIKLVTGVGGSAKREPPPASEPPPVEPLGPKRVPGRPSIYDPAMCERMVELGAEGATEIEMIVGIGVGRTTFYRWLKEPDKEAFREAFTYARELAEAFHARDYRRNAGMPSAVYNAAGKAKFMATVFPQTWRVADAVEMTGKDGGPIETKEMSDRELAQRTAFLLHRAQSRGKTGTGEARH